jgi:hypothetical protein
MVCNNAVKAVLDVAGKVFPSAASVKVALIGALQFNSVCRFVVSLIAWL